MKELIAYRTGLQKKLKDVFSERMEVIPKGKLDQYKKMKSDKYGKYNVVNIWINISDIF